MKVHLHNTLTRKKEEFVPIDPKKVRIYACGPTVYNYAHIGNGRAAVVFDLLNQVMRYVYGDGHVQYVRNITDIDDKIITAAKETGEPIDAITEKFARIYNEDMGSLGVQEPDYQPRATEYIQPMLDMIASLIDAGHAYEAEGHVLFNVPSFKEYGQLSGRNRDDMIAGARVEVAPYKKDPADFVLWKPSNDDQPGWDSPYGRGRPGWHLECSAMNAAINGKHFDIHAGGEDLIFPHHENEIAQSTCAHGGEKYVNYWMHNGYLTVEGQKMSKSLGNVTLVHDLIQNTSGEVIRFALLSAHYRQPLDWTAKLMEQCKQTLDRYYNILLSLKDVEAESSKAPEAFFNALGDDLNTPKAFAELATQAKALSTVSDADKTKLKGEFLASGKLLGLLQQDPETWFKGGSSDDESAEIDAKVVELQTARQEKNYQKADEIRDMLKEKYSVIVSITQEGATWRKE